jgi:hypothetical protein
MTEKAAQEHENSQNIKEMEMNHLERIEELQALYDMKIFIENSNFLQQEQKMMEMEEMYKLKLKERE